MADTPTAALAKPAAKPLRARSFLAALISELSDRTPTPRRRATWTAGYRW